MPCSRTIFATKDLLKLRVKSEAAGTMPRAALVSFLLVSHAMAHLPGDVACEDDSNCTAVWGTCDKDLPWCTIESEMWFRSREELSEGCPWVREDPLERCRETGSIATIGCAAPGRGLDSNSSTIRCSNLTVIFQRVPAFAACCESCNFGTRVRAASATFEGVDC